MFDLAKLYDAILLGDSKTAATITRDALAEGADPLEMVTNHMVQAMDKARRRFEREE